MDLMANFTFEQIEKPLYSAARAMRRKFPMYEVNELVNAVWLKGDVQRVANIKFVRKRAYYDMIHYLRQERGSSFMRHKDSTGHFREKTNRHRDYRADEIKGYLFDNDGSSDYDHIDNKEEAEHILSRLGRLNERYAKILRMYFYDGMTMLEIGEKLNRKLCTISVTISRALKTIKDCEFAFNDIRITDAQKVKVPIRRRQNVFWTPPEEKMEEQPMEEILPGYVVDFEIGNECTVSDSEIDSIKFCLDYE